MWVVRIPRLIFIQRFLIRPELDVQISIWTLWQTQPGRTWNWLSTRLKDFDESQGDHKLYFHWSETIYSTETFIVLQNMENVLSTVIHGNTLGITIIWFQIIHGYCLGFKLVTENKWHYVCTSYYPRAINIRIRKRKTCNTNQVRLLTFCLGIYPVSNWYWCS